MKKSLLAVLTLVILILSAVIIASADNDDVYVVDNTGSFMYQNNVKNTLHTFSQTNEGWDTEEKNGYVTISQSINTQPYSPLTENGCLIYRENGVRLGEGSYISKKYDSPLDLSEYSHIIMPVNCKFLSDDVLFKVSVELKSKYKKFTSEGYIEPERWNSFIVDINSWDERKSVDTISISLTVEGTQDVPYDIEYYIDSIALSANTNLVNSFTLSADSYVLSDGTVVSDYGKITINSYQENVYIESNGFAYQNIGEANCLRVDFSSKSECRGVWLTSFNSLGEIVDESYTDLEYYDELYTAYLPLKNNDISKIRLSFDILQSSDIEISGIIPYSMYLSDENENTGIDTCAVNPNSETIIIKVGGIEEYLNKEIYLFCNDICDIVDNESIAKYQSLAKGNIASNDYIFRIKYTDEEKGRDYLYKKFTAAVKTDDGFVIVGSSKCITNPESYSQETNLPEKKGSGKGIYSSSISFMQEMGASDTAVWVDIGKFFTLEPNKETKFECGKNLYYYDYEYVKTLDTMLKNYKEKNISVTLIAVVSDTKNANLNKILIHKDADLSAKYCAYNTVDRSGVMYLRAFCEYIAEKYCKTLVVNRFVFGDCVSDCSLYNMGRKTLEQYTKGYETGLRVAYNAIRSYSPNTEIYTYIDSVWDSGIPFDLKNRYDSRSFVDSLNECIKEHGNIRWSIAQDLYPKDSQDYFSYNDNRLTKSFDSDRVSFKNMEVVDRYFNEEGLQYNSLSRDYIIIEKSAYANLDEQTVTADYVYNCYKAMNLSVSAYITNRSCNYNNAMKYVDTSLSLMATHFAPDILGVAGWSSVINGFSENNIVKRNIEQSKIAFYEPETKGSVILSDFSAGDHGWKRYGFGERVTSGMSLLGKDNLLSLSLGNIPSGEKRGITKVFDTPFDMSKMPVLAFSVNIASLPESVNRAELSIILVSGDDIYEISGMVKEAVWTDVYCDFSSFSGLGKVDEIRVLISSSDVSFEGPQALMTSVKALSYEYDDAELENALKPIVSQQEKYMNIRKNVLPVLVIIVLVSAAIFIFRRTKRK